MHQRPFPNHNNKGKGQEMMVCAFANDPVGTEAKPNLDKMVERVQHLFKFKHFFDQMGFSSEQRLAITKSIIELTYSSESSEMVQRRSRSNHRFNDDGRIL